MLTLSGYYLLTHKQEETASDCQDAIKVNRDAGVIALADGVTQSFFAKTWARELVNEYALPRDGGAFDQSVWLSEAQKSWEEGIWKIAQGTGDIFLINNLQGREPARATFLAVRYSPAKNQTSLTIEAEAIGDSCLLHFSQGKLKQGFPIGKSEMFSNRTLALSSREAVDKVKLDKQSFTLCEGDHLVLATDAFARFLIQASEVTSPIISEFLALSNEEAVQGFINCHRQAKNLRLENDDIALASLHCGYNEGLIQDFSFSAEPAGPKQNPPQPYTPSSQDGHEPVRIPVVPNQPSSDSRISSTSLGRVLWFIAGFLFAILCLVVVGVLKPSYREGLTRFEKQISKSIYNVVVVDVLKPLREVVKDLTRIEKQISKAFTKRRKHNKIQTKLGPGLLTRPRTHLLGRENIRSEPINSKDHWAIRDFKRFDRTIQ